MIGAVGPSPVIAGNGGRNGGIVPPWLQEPIRIVLPVLPDPDAPVLPVLPPSVSERDLALGG